MCACGPPTTFHRLGPTLLAAPCSTVWQALHLANTFSPSAGVAAAKSDPRSTSCCADAGAGLAPADPSATCIEGSCSRTCTRIAARKLEPKVSQAQSSAEAPIFSSNEQCNMLPSGAQHPPSLGTIVARRVVLQSQPR